MDTFTLLKAIGPPLDTSRRKEPPTFSRKLYSLAYENKIPLSYLNSLPRRVREQRPEFQYHQARLQKRRKILMKISRMFNSERIDYVIFKSLRPFPEYAADIDILNLGRESDYGAMINLLKEHDFHLLEEGPLATTFCDVEKEPKLSKPPKESQRDLFTDSRMGIMIDLYNEVGMNHLVYVDKRKIQNNLEVKDFGGEQVKIFPPEIELPIIMAHSVIKERTYLLEDYYITLTYLKKMKEEKIKKLARFVKEHHLTHAAECFLRLTKNIFEIVNKTKNRKLERILSLLPTPSSCRMNKDLKEEEFAFPWQFNRILWMRSLLEKIRDDQFRRSLLNQFLHLPQVLGSCRFWEKLGVT